MDSILYYEMYQSTYSKNEIKCEGFAITRIIFHHAISLFVISMLITFSDLNIHKWQDVATQCEDLVQCVGVDISTIFLATVSA